MRFIEQVVARGGLCALLFTSACEDVGGLMVDRLGLTPIADARVLGQLGKEVTVSFSGQPVSVTLDGSFSHDPDGHIASYRWLGWRGEQTMASGGLDGGALWSWTRTLPEGGVAGPDAGIAGWPADIARPVVRLGEGTYVFTLWVVDDTGNTSLPASVRIQVKAPMDPGATAQCVASAADMTAPACIQCLCGVSDACRAAVSASKCDNACWALLSCIGSKCPDSTTQMTCVPASCAEFLPPTAPMAALDGARGLGVMGADCFSRCGDSCK